MFLLTDTFGSIVPVHPRVRDRVAAHLHADRIDHELAHGAAPEESIELALRARALTSWRSRRELAAGLRRVLDEAADPSPASLAVAPLNRSRVTATADELETLRRQLLARGPVAVAGVAQTRELLTTPFGALRDRRSRESLSGVVRRAIEALSIENYSLA